MKRKSNLGFEIIAHSVMIFVVVAVVLPFLLLFLSSITKEEVLIRNGYSFFPEQFSLDAYRYIFMQGDVIIRSYLVTILLTVIGTLCNVIMSTMMAYGLSIKALPFRKFLTFYVVFMMLFNGGLVPTYIMYTNTFHIKNTMLALLVPGLMMGAMNVLLIRTYIRTSIPEALFEAASIDGASHMNLFFNIVLPLGKPIIVTMAMFAGLGYWNDWVNGLYYLSGPAGRKWFTIQNLLNEMLSNIQYLSSAAGSNISGVSIEIPSVGVRMAIAFVAIIPVALIFPFLQKYFQKGITLGGVKG